MGDRVDHDVDAYRLLFEASPKPTFVFDRSTLAILAVNDAACARYGWSRAEFLGMTIREIRSYRRGAAPRAISRATSGPQVGTAASTQGASVATSTKPVMRSSTSVCQIGLAPFQGLT